MARSLGDTADFLKSVGRFSVAPLANFILGVIAVVLLTRFFSPEVYGEWNLFNVTANVCVAVVYVGLSEGVLRFAYALPSGWSIQEFLWKCILLASCVFFVFSVVMLLFYDAASVWLFHKASLYRVCLLLIYTFALMLLNFFFVSYYRAMNLSGSYTIQQIGVQFFSKLFILMSLFFGGTTDAVLTFNVGGMVCFLLFCIYIQRKEIFPKRLDTSYKGFAEVLRFSLSSWPGALLARLSLFLIPFVLAHRLGAYEVGLYAATSVFVAVVVVLNNGFMTYWVSFVYKNARLKQDLIIEVHNYIILSIFVVFSVMIVFQHLIYMLIGTEYQMSRAFFTLVMSDVFFSMVEATTKQGIALEKKAHENAIILFVSLCIQFICAWFLVEYMGVAGAAVATLIAALIRCLLSTWRGQKYYRSIESLYKTSAGIVMIVILASSNYFFSQEYWWEVGAVGVVGAMLAILFRNDVRKVFATTRTAWNEWRWHKKSNV